ncbi:hypothetical protein LZZ85_00930 [Terrimonas sp. NA20]|uniref:Capsid protein n=1 Tax=Terrimonas ginsenosidimutans TaxID=2908004 RepID=A0ABS9KKG7_9BACT|nr:hypothetical protein [Terrimonas ginsenosidimutans]MCG2612815.1 hypothetical protein [Terrimonas ginsenosidimutans]
MAISRYNVVMHNTSGIVGDLVQFSQRHGKTIIGKRRKKAATASEGQLEIRRRFKKASNYAKASMEIPERRALYEAKAVPGVTPYNLALGNYFTAPEIVEIINTSYTGAAGGRIDILAEDDVSVRSLDVSVFTAQGTPVESGAAVKTAEGFWHYTTTGISPQLEGTRVVVTATNIPGNTSTAELVL